MLFSEDNAFSFVQSPLRFSIVFLCIAEPEPSVRFNPLAACRYKRKVRQLAQDIPLGIMLNTMIALVKLQECNPISCSQSTYRKPKRSSCLSLALACICMDKAQLGLCDCLRQFKGRKEVFQNRCSAGLSHGHCFRNFKRIFFLNCLNLFPDAHFLPMFMIWSSLLSSR